MGERRRSQLRGFHSLRWKTLQPPALHHRYAHAGRVGLRKLIGDVIAKLLLPIRARPADDAIKAAPDIARKYLRCMMYLMA
jgi:hypothetical protein